MSSSRSRGRSARRRSPRRTGADPLWSPSNLSPSLWIEPRTGEFTTDSTTYLVNSVSDRSSSANDLGPAGGTANNPDMQWSAASFKRRALDFRGAATDDTLLSGSAVDLSQPYLVWALVDADATGSSQNIFRCLTASHGLARLSSNNFRLLFGSNSADSLQLTSAGTGVFAILYWVDPVNGAAEGWIDDWSAAAATVDRTGSGTLTAPNETIYLGARNNTGTNNFDGRIASFGFAPAATSPDSDTRDALGLYLNAQFSTSITTTITDPANLPGYSGVEQPPTQVVVFGIGQSNRLHDADAGASAAMPAITGGGGSLYQTEYPTARTYWTTAGSAVGLEHWRAQNKATAASRTFGRELVWAQRAIAAGPDYEFFIAKVALGSTDLANDWDPDTTESTTSGQPGYMYWRAKDRLSTVAAAIRTGATLIVAWTQGEADSDVLASANAYETNQGNLFDAIATLASSLSLGAPSFYDTQLHEDWGSPPTSRPYFSTVVAAKVAVAAARSDTTLILQPSATIPLQSGDEIHITAEGQALMGEAECDAAGF